MARINLERRAEIGEAKRARTRAAILEAGRACYAAPDGHPVTVEAVTRAAGLAKGTFYLHFRDLAALEGELGDALIAELGVRLEPARIAIEHPLSRMTTVITILLNDLAASPTEARLVARAAETIPDFARATQARLRQDLTEMQRLGLLAIGSVETAARIITAILVQVARDLGAGRIDGAAVPDVVRTVLRAAGCTPLEADREAAAARRIADGFGRRTLRQAAAPSQPGPGPGPAPEGHGRTRRRALRDRAATGTPGSA